MEGRPDRPQAVRRCLDRNHNRRCDSSDTSGELRFDYLLWIKYDPKTGRPIEGKCVHPITSGTKDFAGARGVLNMHDAPLGHEEIPTYQGEIVLNAVDKEQLHLDRAAPIDLSPRKYERPDADAGTWPSSVRLAHASRAAGPRQVASPHERGLSSPRPASDLFSVPR